MKLPITVHHRQAPRAAAPVPGWGAVYALTLCAATLIASEFMPISLLTPMAADLHMTEGRAGQAIAVSGIFAVLTSLSISTITRGIDRRRLLLALTALMLAAGAVVTLAPNALVFMVSRALIGIVVGGFWSMSASTVMRLVPAADVPRALGVLNAGGALSATISAPLGSFLGQYIGWRAAFAPIIPLAALTLIWLFARLPSMPAGQQHGGAVFRVLQRRYVVLGMAAITFAFLGRATLQTYLRPFLETITGVDVSTLSLLFLVNGIAGVLGSALVSAILPRRLAGVLVAVPLAMSSIALALTAQGGSWIAVGALLAVWGLFGAAVPVGWWTWLSRALPKDAEAGGGLMVAVIQLANTLGATAGGALYDAQGYQHTFAFSAAALGVAALLAAAAWRAGRPYLAGEHQPELHRAEQPSA